VVRSSSDGKYISYCSRDKTGILQIFVISPRGGDPIQITEHTADVLSGARWSPDNKSIAYVWDNSIVICSISGGRFENRYKRLTSRTVESPANLVWSNDGKTIAFNRWVDYGGKKGKKKQIFIIKLDPSR
jgi:Tol biopolymer transport system component